MIGIIGALEAEVKRIIECMDIEKTEEITGITYYSGTLKDKKLVIAKCGVGKVNAALCTQSMIMKYSPNAIINIGVAGGLKNTKIGDLVIATACVQHDYDTSVIDGPEFKNVINAVDKREIETDMHLTEIFQRAAEKLTTVHKGIIATGDIFVADPEKCKELDEEFDAYAVEMESGAIAQVSCLNGVPFAILRTISDNANDDAVVDFPEFVESSAKKVQQIMQEAITEI